MPGALPPVPVADWDAHVDDSFQRQAAADLAAVAEARSRAEAVDAAGEADFQQRAQAQVAEIGQAHQQVTARVAEETDFQTQARSQIAAIAQAVPPRANTTYPGDTGSAPPRTADAPSGELQDYARQAAVKAGIDPETFVRQIQQESGFNPSARNPSGATGIAQIVPSAHPGVDPTDPRASLDYAANWMGQLTKQYGGDKAKALAAYNAGPGNVEKYGGIPPFEETQRYVKIILGERGGGDALGADSPAPGGRNADIAPQTSPGERSRVEALGQFEQGLPYEEAAAICGPVAALALIQQHGGRNPSLAEVTAAAKRHGWTSTGGMNGIANEKALLDEYGVANRLDPNPDFGHIAEDAANGNPVIISTPVHYWFVSDYDKTTGKLYVGKTGTSRKGGGSWMSAQQIATLDGGINGALFVDNPQSPTPSVGAAPAPDEDTSQLGPLGGPGGSRPSGPLEDVIDPTQRRLGPDGITPSQIRVAGGLPAEEMRDDYARISRGRPQPMDVLAAVDVPNRIAFTAADAALSGGNLGEALFQSGVEGGRQAKGADILRDAGVTDPTVLDQAGKVIDAAVDYTNVIPGVTFAKKAGMVRQLIAEPLGAVVGAEIAGEVGKRIGGETGQQIGEVVGGLAGAGLAGSRYAAIEADPRTRQLGIGPASRYEPGREDFAGFMQAHKDAAAGGERYTPPTGPAQKTSMRDMEAYYARQEALAAAGAPLEPPPTTRLADALDDAPPHPGPRPGEDDAVVQRLQAAVDRRLPPTARTPRPPGDPGMAAPELGAGARQGSLVDRDALLRPPVDPGTAAGPLGRGADVRVPSSARQAVAPGFADVPAGTRQVDLRGEVIPPAEGAGKPSLYDRFQTVRFAGMLSSTATQILNNTANAVNTFADVGLKALSVPVDIAVSRASGGQRTRYAAELAPQVRGLVAGMLTGAKKIPHIMATGIDPETAAALDMPHRGLRSGSKAVDAVVEAPLRALSAADAMWRGGAYAGHAAALATRQAVREGLTGVERAARVDHILTNLHEFKGIEDEARKLAARAVFQERRGEIDPAITLLKGTKLRYVSDVVLPFVRTPYNVAAQGIGMTPLGFAGALKAARAGQTGEAIDRAVRAGVGTAALGYGLSLAASGYITGAMPDDAAERSTLPDGFKPYALRVPAGDGAVYVPLQMLGPIAMPLGIAGALGDLYKRGQAGADPTKLAYRSITSLGKYVGDQAFLQGLSAIPNIIDAPERYLERFLEGYASSLMPASALQKQVDQFLGRAPRDPKGALEGFLSASPLTSPMVDARLTPLGVERETASGWRALLGGTRVGVEADEPTLAAFREAGTSIPAPPKSVIGHALTEPERRRVQIRAGEILREQVSEWQADPEFRALPKDERADLLERARGRAREDAGVEVLDALSDEELARRRAAVKR